MTAKATQYSTRIVLRKYSNGASIKISPTIAAGDFKVSIDGGALSNLTNLPVESPVGSGLVLLTLTAAEMNGDVITIIGIDQTTTKQWNDLVFNINTSYSGVVITTPIPSVSKAGIAFCGDDFGRNVINFVDGNRLTLGTQYGFKATIWCEQTSYSTSDITKGNQLLANGFKFGTHAPVHVYRKTHTVEETWTNVIKPVHDAIVAAFGVTPTTFANHNELEAIVADPALMAYLQTKGYTIMRIAGDGVGAGIDWNYNGTYQIVNGINLSNMLPSGFATLEPYLQYARDNNVILVFMSHSIGTTLNDQTYTEELLMQTINYVVSNNMKFYHMDELVPSLFA